MAIVFRSRRRDIVFTQYEHARLAGELALAWRPEDIPLPFEAWVRGVALHDRGYDVVDADDIFGTSTERWLEIQGRGIVPREENPVVDLVVALHVRRLMGDRPERAELAAELDALLPNLRAASGVDEAAALAADAVTGVCDLISFDFCLEEPADGQVRGISYAVDRNSRITMEPWPFGVPRIAGLVYAYRGSGYPERLEPVVVEYEVVPK